MKRILVISQYFYPEQFRINDICAEWVKRGYDVSVITGIPNYPEGKYYPGYGLFRKRREIFQGAKIRRNFLLPRGNNSIMLFLNYLSFVISGFFWQLFTKTRADLVFIFEVSPMSQALPGVWYARRSKIPCFLYVQDLWPENVEVVAGIKNKTVLRLIGRMVDYIYRYCTRIFTTSPSFAAAIMNRGVEAGKLTYWPQYAEDFYRPLRNSNAHKNRTTDEFVVTFAGNIGYAQGLDLIPQMVAEAKQRASRKFSVRIVGEGRFAMELKRIVRSADLDPIIKFFPRKPPECIPGLMAESDVAFLSLSGTPLFAMTIPAKLQSYMACGIPILASVDGEAARIIEESGAGLCAPAGDGRKLADCLVRFLDMSQDQIEEMGNRARSYYDEHFDKKYLMDQMDAYIGTEMGALSDV
ncbi:MAG: glycosyltransferase family 4 protein [Saccharofermentanales bacterium]